MSDALAKYCPPVIIRRDKLRQNSAQLQQQFVMLSFLVLIAFGLAGCGSTDGPNRFDVRGKVTFNGRPVPAGQVVFEPDRSQGNRGPAAYAKIVDGRYETSREKGTIGGPHRARVQGSDGKVSPEMAGGLPLFPEYTTEIDLPLDDHTWDIDVPVDRSEGE